MIDSQAMRELPESITTGVFRSANGEVGWRRAEIERALLAVRDSGQVILGGEVWLVIGPSHWDGLIPDRDGGVPGVWTWDTKPRAFTESWQTYCERTAAESIEAVRRMQVEQATLPELGERIRFNVNYVEESEI